MFGDIFGRYDLGGAAIGTQWVETRDAVKHPTMHREVQQNNRINLPQRSIVPRLRSHGLLALRFNFKKKERREIPSWSVAKTLRSQCRGPGWIPGEGTRSYMLHATNKTWHRQINKYFLKERIKGRR